MKRFPFSFFQMFTVVVAIAAATNPIFSQPKTAKSGETQKPEVAFAFVQVSPSLRSQSTSPGSLPEASPKFQTANKVFQNLLRARGDLRQQAPKFVMNRREKYVAWMDAEKVLIGLEERAFDVCTSFGADSLNALAALLAHEITHYYEKHDWTRHFATQQQGNGLGQQLQHLDEGIKHEAQADYLGGFLAVSAGYKVLGLMPRLLDALYQAYGLTENINGYPSLPERKSMSENAQSLLQNLDLAYQMSNKLALLGEFVDAEIYLRYILKDYQSREIYNNAGVLDALAALGGGNHPTQKFYYPFEIDPKSRLSNLKGRSGSRDELLQESLSHFEKSKLLDPTYSPAWLNIGCVYALTSAWDDANYFAHKAEKLARTNSERAAAKVLKGIISTSTADDEEAIAHFIEAEMQGSTIAKLNREKLEGKTPTVELPKVGTGEFGLPIEKIEDLSLEKFALKPDVEKVIEIEEGKVSFGVKNLPKSQIFVHMADRGKHTVIIQTTASDYIGETEKNIKIGSTKKEALEKYGVPSRSVATPDGEVLIYPYQQIGFQFVGGKVEEWFVFRIK